MAISGFNESFKSKVEDWISLKEKKEIKNTFSKLTKEEQDEFLSIYEDNLDIKEPTKTLILDLKKSVESDLQIKKKTFEWLKESVSSKSEVMKKLFNIADLYFVEKLKLTWLENNSNVKLILWDKLISNLNIGGGVNIFVSKLKQKLSWLFTLKSKPGVENSSKTWESENILSIFNKLEDIFQNLWAEETKADKTADKDSVIDYIDSLMWDSFKKLKENKNKDLSSVEKVSELISTSELKFEDIKSKTLEKAKSFEKTKSGFDWIVWLLWKLPKSWQKEITWFMKNIAKDFPIIWMIFSLFFGEWFLEWNEKNEKWLKSIVNLSWYIDKLWNTSELKKLKLDNIKKIKPENLKEFFTYLDWKKIDYTKDWFWKGILEWDKKNEKLNNVYDLLVWKDKKILWKDWDIDSFMGKLNWLNEREQENSNKAEQEKIDKKRKATRVKEEEFKRQQAELKSSQEKLVEDQEAIKIKKEELEKGDGISEDDKKKAEAELAKQEKEALNKAKEIKQKEEQEAKKAAEIAEEKRLNDIEQSKLDFHNSVLNIWTNKMIKYNWIDYKVWFLEWNILVLWNTKYKLELLAIEHDNKDILNNIDFKWNDIEFKYRSWLISYTNDTIKLDMLKNIITWLLEKWEYEEKIKWEPAKFIIKKA